MGGRNNKTVATVAGLCIAMILVGLLTVVGSGGGGGSSGSGSSNTAPVASAACDNTPLNMDLNGDLNASVIDPDSPILSFSLASLPTTSKGTAMIDPTGVFTYSPNLNARGVDSFGYVVDDLSGGQDMATVTVIIGDTRIMPLGDSITTAMITSGSPPPALHVGYRKPLYGLLVSGGYSFDFVGGDVFGTDASLSPFAPDNAGHGGFTASDIVFGGSASGYPVDGVRSWLEQNPADIVLLHIGTNDFFSTTAGDVAMILDEIDD